MNITWYKKYIRASWRIRISILPCEWETVRQIVAPRKDLVIDDSAEALRELAHALFRHTKHGLEYCVELPVREKMTYSVDSYGNLIRSSGATQSRVVVEAVVAPQVLERYSVDGNGRITAHRTPLRQYSNAHPCNPPPTPKKDQV